MTDIKTGIAASTLSGRLYVVGGASKIDTHSLIEAAYKQKIARADSLNVKIGKNNSVIDAYTKLQSLGKDMQKSLYLLKQTYGYSTAGDSVYDNMSAYLSTSASGINVDSVLGVSVDEGATKGAYSLEVLQIATKMKVNSSEITDKTAALNFDGSFTLTGENGTDSQITVTTDMSLEDIVAAINAVSVNTNVSASLIKTDDNDYTMVITGTQTGENLVYTSTDGTDIMNSLGVTQSDGSFANISQAAQDAKIKLDGLEITSSSNTIEDVLDGVDLTLYAALAGETINLEIDYDYTAVKKAITDFIDSYNEFRKFYDQHQNVGSDGKVSDDSILFSDSLLDGLNNQISALLSSMFGDDNDTVTNLAEIGIKFDAGNHLIITDEALLNDVLLNNYDELRELFQTSVQSDNDNFKIISNNSTLRNFNISMNISVDGSGDITNVSVGGDSSLFTFSGNLITGAQGSIYEGLSFAYVDDVGASVNINFRQGMADLLYNTIDTYTDSTHGLVKDAASSIRNLNTDLTDDAKRIKERAGDFYERQIDKYAQMEVEIAYAETLLSTVRALLGIKKDD